MQVSKVIRIVGLMTCVAMAQGAWAANDQQSRSQSQTQGQSQNTAGWNQLQKSMALNHVHHINQKEIEMAKMGQEQAQSPRIKEYARQLESAHKALDQRAQEIAKNSNVKLQGFQPATYEKATMDQLKRLQGSEFDQAYMQLMVQGHRQAMQDLQDMNKNVQDQQISQFIKSSLNDVNGHLSAAQSLQKQVGRGVAGEQQSQGQ